MLKIAWAPIYNHTLPDGHRFPMEKYELLPKQLVHQGIVTDHSFFSPRALTDEEILKVHSSPYLDKLKTLSLTKSEERRSGFPLSNGLIEREIIINAGTLQCTDYAIEYGASMNIAGGTHHAYSDRAEGFCLLNDIAIAARYVLDQNKAKQILVVDLDVHQGNGTAKIFQNESRVFTFSMHGEKNYPHHKETSDLDIALSDGTEDDKYLKTLHIYLDQLFDDVRPDFIFFQSGVDVLRTDKLGRLGLTMAGCAERDRLVFQKAHDYGLPIVAAMGGGYSADIRTILEAHVNTYQAAVDVYF